MRLSLAQLFDAARKTDRKVLVAYVTAGDPSLEATERLLGELDAAGADIIELGVPFSDPMADGPVIQAASQRALAAGATLPKIMEMARRAGPKLSCPLVLFSYYNVLMQYGVEKLAAESAGAGIAGWLVVDLPHEEAGEIDSVLRKHGLDRIPLLAPTTPPDRAREILRTASGFVYYITVAGVTGARTAVPADLAANLGAIRGMTRTPVVAGFGVSSPETAREVSAHADGVVVGSAIVRLMGEAAMADEGIHRAAGFVASLRQALDAPK
jgi:tryptophan synthase alpha chain